MLSLLINFLISINKSSKIIITSKSFKLKKIKAIISLIRLKEILNSSLIKKEKRKKYTTKISLLFIKLFIIKTIIILILFYNIFSYITLNLSFFSKSFKLKIIIIII